MKKISSSTEKVLALSMLAGVGPATLRKISCAESFLTAPIDSLAEKFPVLAKALNAADAWEKARELAASQIEQAEKFDAQILSALDQDYPQLLANTKDDPFILYIKGNLPATPDKSVAIIGTRKPTKHGEIIAERITEFFIEKQWSVVSGLAIGCDAIAHRISIANGGHTVAVLAHGLQTIAPSQHKKLAEEILENGGALLSEYKFGQGVIPQQFVKRDRTQAGLAQGVVMVQSDLKGGSLHASRAAISYGRWLAVPHPTTTDLNNHEPKIQANLLLSDGEISEKENLLKCNQLPTSKLIILKDKNDYLQLTINPTVPDLESPSKNHDSCFDSPRILSQPKSYTTGSDIDNAQSESPPEDLQNDKREDTTSGSDEGGEPFQHTLL